MTNSERLRLIQNMINESWMCCENESTSFYKGIMLGIETVINTESDVCESFTERTEKHNNACPKTSTTSGYEENDVDDTLKCAVCGEVPHIRTVDTEDQIFYYVECPNCANGTVLYESRREAVKAWNRWNR